MKKVVIILSVVTFLSLGLLLYTSILYNNKKEDNLKLQQDITNLKIDNENQANDNEKKELELQNLKETNNKDILELKEWNQMKEKLEQAIQ